VLSLTVGFCFAVVSTGCVSQKSNLLRNGSFEDATSDSAPAGWNVDGVSPSYRLDTQIASAGKQSLRVEFRDGFNEQGYAGTLQTIDASGLAGKTIRFTADLRRTNNESVVGIWLLVADAVGNKLNYINSYEQPLPNLSQWQTHALTVSLPRAAAKIKLGAAIYEKDGEAWIDNLQLWQIRENE
jgi:hypothetical protein